MWFVGATIAAFVGYWLLAFKTDGAGCCCPRPYPPS